MFGFKLLARLFKDDTEAQVAPGVMFGVTPEEEKRLDMIKRHKELHAGDGKDYRLHYDLRSPYPIWKRVKREHYKFNSQTLFMVYNVGPTTPLFYSVKLNDYFFVKPLFKRFGSYGWECTHGAMSNRLEISGYGHSKEYAYKEFLHKMVMMSNGDFIHVNPLIRKRHEQM